MSKTFGIVILNYLTIDETIELIQSLSGQIWFHRTQLYIVDNGSYNDSIERLKRLTVPFEIISSTENLGFAKGNNLGIQKAKEDGCQFILCINNDTLISPQNNFLDTINNIYDNDQNIAVIAPSISNLDGIYQNPFRKNRFSKYEIFKIKLFYLSSSYKLYYLFRVYLAYNLITLLTKTRKTNVISSKPTLNESAYIYAGHGSCLIFTPTFFNTYNGFDEHTFLFCEEFLLAEMLYSKKLSCYFENTLHVIHKESKTTNLLSASYKEKVKFTLKHTFESCKYFANVIKF